MIELKNKKQCCGCGACEQICPRHCILMQYDSEGFLYPIVDSASCISCGLCEKACQYSNLSKECRNPLEQFYFIHDNQDTRRKSSSGGTFICLAEEVIKNKGVVFGASFDNEFNVVISYAESLNDCWKFVGSKYVQAKVGNAYKLAKKFLQEDRLVLFTGTPCQINGLQHYLGNDYDNLLKLDFTCHAIPSPVIWNKYLKAIKGKYEIQSVNFRDKEVSGWQNYGITIIGKNGDDSKILVSSGNRQNLYMKGFIQFLYDRPSCSNCVSRKFRSSSDIMIGDFWGVEKYHSEPLFNDNKGISIAIAVSEKGKEYLNKIRTYGQMGSIPIEELEMDKSHDCILKSAHQHPNRNIFFFLYNLGLPLRPCIWLCINLNMVRYVSSIYRKIKMMIDEFYV